MPTDREFLRHYAGQKDETAFAEVVRRHTDLVYSVALRVSRNPQLAEDVTQKVFTKLAQQAGRLGHYETIVGWLHTAARHGAIDAIRGEERRRTREQEASVMQIPSSAPELNWESIGPLLDEAVSRLREDDRQAVLLRFFKNLSHQEIGAALGLSEDAARKRIERALEKLRGYFTSRGVTASSTMLATAISANSVQAAPAGLSAKIAQAPLAAVPVAGTMGSGILFALLMNTKTKVILTLVALLVIGGSAAFLWIVQPAPPAASVPAAPNKPSPSTAATVAAPVLAPVTPVPARTETAMASPVAPSAPPVQIVPGPKSDLNEAILAGIQALQIQNTRGFLQTLMPPSAARSELSMDMAQKVDAAALDLMVAKIDQNPAGAVKLNSMLNVLNAIQAQNLKPELNAEGTRASYMLDPPVDGHGNVIFNKINGFWYLNGM